ncbi:L-aspartate oxidase [Candidatus Zixiibacteriota bacterium]
MSSPDSDLVQVDYLIIGSGIAGLSFALKVCQHGTVAVITKKEEAESNTNYAQGGIASVLSAQDTFEMHIADTLKGGVDLNRREAVEALVREGPDRIRELMAWGVEFSRRKDESGEEILDLGMEGGHSRNRILHVADMTGRELERVLLEKAKESGNIQIYKNHIAIDLITEHQLEKKTEQPASGLHCWGAYVLDIEGQRVLRFLAGVTLLCTGGVGQLYSHTTNPRIATGDGLAMAYRAGAQVANLEFMQFHPTSLYHPGRMAFLISEAVRGEGGILRLSGGHPFMKDHDSRGDLAPRDVVARAIDRELKKSGEECVYLDVTHLGVDFLTKRFPNIYGQCLSQGIDAAKSWIPVVPAAHYMCGGVVVNLDGQTAIKGLYACGEVAHTGVHGANRLASNSLLEAVVFAHRAAQIAIEETDVQADHGSVGIPIWNDEGTFDSEEWVVISHDRAEIQLLMTDYVSIVRSDKRLQRARERIHIILREIDEFYRRTPVTGGLVELRNLATVAELVIRSALMRKESRGLHYTIDYPQRDDKNWLKDTVIKSKGAAGGEKGIVN